MSPPAKTGIFPPSFFRFLRDLAKNNNRAWFQGHKSVYESEVLAPSLHFVDALGPRMRSISPSLVADARPVGGSLMRIYRDVRFSRDKSPYRTSMGLHFFHKRTDEHDGGLPGFFLHLAPGDSFVGAGVWMPPTSELAAIRRAIVDDSPGWRKARAVGLDEDEDALKRVPRGFDPEHPYAEELKRKSYVASTAFRDTDITSPGFPDRFFAECKRLDPLNRFVARAANIEY